MTNHVKKIAIWMYTNDNGYIPREDIRKRLKEEIECEIFTDFDMRDCYVIDGKVFSQCGTNLSEFDLLFHMNADEQNDYQLDILKAIEDSGVIVVNETDSFFRCRDKFQANMLLRQAGVRVPKAALLGINTPRKVIDDLFLDWGKLVYKCRDGHGAKGVIQFSDAEQFWDFFLATKDHIKDYYLEQFIHFGDSDCRVEIFNHEVIGGYSRYKNHSFKTNISSGGKMMPRTMGKEQYVARQAAKALGINGTIVDMVESLDDGEIYVLEVNPLLGIFVESAMKAETKMPYTEPHLEYSYDGKKVEAIVNYIVLKLEQNIFERERVFS